MPAFGSSSWSFGADPFRRARAALAPLDPADLGFYYNFYEGPERQLVTTLLTHGASSGLADGSRAVLLVSGPAGCGRTSLENLLRYDINSSSIEPAVAASVKLAPELRNNTARAWELALGIEDAVSERDEDAGTAVGKANAKWREAIIPGVPATTDRLLSQLRKIVGARLPGSPIVVSFDALDHNVGYDACLDAVKMVRDFADVVILSVVNANDASFIRGKLKEEWPNVAWINAPKMTAARLQELVEARLEKERAAGGGGGHPLHPFAPDALAAVFAATDGGEEVPLPIRIALRVLIKAMARKAADLAANPATVDMITAQDVRAAF